MWYLELNLLIQEHQVQYYTLQMINAKYQGIKRIHEVWNS